MKNKKVNLIVIASLFSLIITSTNSCKKQDSVVPTCSDGIKNQNEMGIDCGGECAICGTGSCSNGPAVITDVDGNTYNTVSIGTQCWIKANLKTTRFQDGSAIEKVEEDSIWVNTNASGNPAWCYFDNNMTHNAIYGKLYNGYAVADPRNVCPAGWHVPSDAEWTTLTQYLGGLNYAGGHMKAIPLWIAPNGDATNLSGFTAYGGGLRNGLDGYFQDLNYFGVFWSRSEAIDSKLWLRYIIREHGGCSQLAVSKSYGYSVRCIKD